MRMKFRERLYRFFQGRNGTDQLARLFSWIALILVIVSTFTTKLLNGWVAIITWALSIVCIVYSFYRTLSKDVTRRRVENQRYMSLVWRIKGYFKNQIQRFKERKVYKYFRCPGCRATLRVPRGKGKVQITCKRCGKRFLGKT